MTTTKLLSNGRVTIPKDIRSSHSWVAGQELVVVDIGDGIILKPASPFKEEALDAVAGCMKSSTRPQTIQDMDNAIAKGCKDWTS